MLALDTRVTKVLDKGSEFGPDGLDVVSCSDRNVLTVCDRAYTVVL